MEKLYTPKTFSKMAGGRMHTPHPFPLNPPLVISYKNHRKSQAYFSHYAPLYLFFFTERQSQKEGAWHNASLLNTLLMTALHLVCDMIIIGKELTIAFSAIDKLVTFRAGCLETCLGLQTRLETRF